MALKDTINAMDKLLCCLSNDLKKAAKGNSAACQRVRTCSIKFGKVAKVFRKESIKDKKSGRKKKATRKTSRKKTVRKKAARKKTKRKTTRRRR